MPKLRRQLLFRFPVDGYGARSLPQDTDNPLGIDGRALHSWLFETRTFRNMTGAGGGAEGIDRGFCRTWIPENVGAWILGRNMFGPIRGPWASDPAGKAGGATIPPTTRRFSC